MIIVEVHREGQNLVITSGDNRRVDLVGPGGLCFGAYANRADAYALAEGADLSTRFCQPNGTGYRFEYQIPVKDIN